MSINITLTVENDLMAETLKVIEGIGIDFQTITKILMKRIVKEQSISFLLENGDLRTKTSSTSDHYTDEEIVPRGFLSKIDPKQNMTKKIAIRLFENEGIHVSKNVTFSSKNRSVNYFWANPEYEMLRADWYLILNDWGNSILYLFLIPANSIKDYEMIERNDRKHLIDLQISYNDITFTDSRSNYSFAKYLVKRINY